MPGSATKRDSVLLFEEGGVGGVAEYTSELAAALARAGWQVDVATATDHRYPPAPGVGMHGLFPYLRGNGGIRRLLRKLRLSVVVNGLGHLIMYVPFLRLARRHAVVHTQGQESPLLGAPLALALRAAGCRIVYTPHNTFDRGARSYRRLHALIRRCAAAIIVHSEFDRAALPPAAAAKAVVVPHGEYTGLARRGEADASADESRAALGLDAERICVLLFGQLRRDKGVVDLLEAACEVPGLQVLIAGSDNGALAEVAELRADPRLAGRLVLREGYVSQEEVGTLFAAADVVALPYHVASASGVLLLAYGHARPVVVYPVGGLPEYVVDGETGWTCDEARPASLAAALRKVAATERQELRARGEAGRRLADERFDWDAIAEQTVMIYRSVVGG